MESFTHIDTDRTEVIVRILLASICRKLLRSESASILTITPRAQTLTSRMTNIDAKTPQLKVIKESLEGCCTLNMQKNLLPRLAKDFKSQLFPKAPELPDETGEEHVKKWGEIQALYPNLKYVSGIAEPPSCL